MDEAQVFCADDGSRLNEETAAASDLQKTMMAPPPSYTRTPEQPPSWPPPGGQALPGAGGQHQQQPPGWGQTPPQQPSAQPPYGQQQYGGQQQQYGGQQYGGPPPGQQPYGQPPPQGAQWGGQYQQAGGQPPAYGVATGKRKGLSLAALILGALSALGAMLFITGIVSRYGYAANFRYRTDEFMIGSLVASVLGGLAIVLGSIALAFALKNAARWSGKGLALAGIILGLAGSVTAAVLNITSEVRFYGSYNSSRSSSDDSSTTYNSNESKTDSNRNGGAASDSRASSSSMTEDEKYRIFYAAGRTNDRELQTETAKLIGIIDANGQPTAYYQTFLVGAADWGKRDYLFVPTVDTPEKAREYVMAHK